MADDLVPGSIEMPTLRSNTLADPIPESQSDICGPQPSGGPHDQDQPAQSILGKRKKTKPKWKVGKWLSDLARTWCLVDWPSTILEMRYNISEGATADDLSAERIDRLALMKDKQIEDTFCSLRNQMKKVRCAQFVDTLTNCCRRLLLLWTKLCARGRQIAGLPPSVTCASGLSRTLLQQSRTPR